MAKELPYFKFEPAIWESGNIQMCSRESKGLFIELCSIYWVRLGELPYALALQKHCNGNKDALQELIFHEIIGVLDNQIVIEFLDEQLSEFNNTSEIRRNAANKRWKNANAMQKQCKSNAIREEEIREEEIREEERREEEITIWPSFENFWNKYDKKQDRDKCEMKWKKINHEGREKIMSHLDYYIPSTPDKNYRKNPATYLNNESWNNEIIINNPHGKPRITAQGTLDRLNSYTN